MVTAQGNADVSAYCNAGDTLLSGGFSVGARDASGAQSYPFQSLPAPLSGGRQGWRVKADCPIKVWAICGVNMPFSGSYDSAG
jgi:hypothetical protein